MHPQPSHTSETQARGMRSSHSQPFILSHTRTGMGTPYHRTPMNRVCPGPA